MRSHPLAVATSLSPQGAPQAAMLGVAVNEQLELVLDTVDSSRKYHNLKRDPRIAVVFGAGGAYTTGAHDERTVQYEGLADFPEGEELRRVQDEIYFPQFPDGRPRLAWKGITYIRIRPRWLRYSDYNRHPPEIVEFAGESLKNFLASA
jgi:general stress protein 26